MDNPGDGIDELTVLAGLQAAFEDAIDLVDAGTPVPWCGDWRAAELVVPPVIWADTVDEAVTVMHPRQVRLGRAPAPRTTGTRRDRCRQELVAVGVHGSPRGARGDCSRPGGGVGAGGVAAGHPGRPTTLGGRRRGSRQGRTGRPRRTPMTGSPWVRTGTLSVGTPAA